ncbi:MAG: AMP-binding protein, partial [Betaproteobacteria bacterium]|nr:AMP-binding protein [Betaproteobacteria bacterium]
SHYSRVMADTGRPPETLKALFETSCARWRVLPAFTSMGVTLSYGEVERRSGAFGAFLRQELGLAPGERIAIMLPNLLQYPIALIGALRAGLAVVNVNPLYTAPELRTLLEDSGAAAVLVLENFAHTLEHALAGTCVQHVVTTQVGDAFPVPKRWAVNLAVKHVKRMVPAWHIPGAIAFNDARAPELPATAVDPADVAFLQYTGGTTGRPKGVVLTHANMTANVRQTLAWAGAALAEGEETVVTALPLYHIFALTANLLLFFRLGGRNLLIPNPRDLPAFVAELKRMRFSGITGVNTLYAALLDAPGFDAACRANHGALKIAVAGGMAVQRSVAERWQRATGAPLVEGYGLTEASPNVCANPIDAREFSGKLGLPLPETEVSIRDERGAKLALGEVGEICVRGPQVTRGYWNAPEETAQAFFPDGWLRTGDLGRIDERGYVEFVDRRKDVIVVSGFKAYPSEIEAVALAHPGVKDAGAVGMPHPKSGEAVALFVVKRDPALSAEALAAHCAERLAPYKRPVRIEFRDALPKSPLGKVLHRELKAAA